LRIEIVAQSDLPVRDRGRYLLFAEMQREGGIALFRKIGKVPLRPVAREPDQPAQPGHRVIGKRHPQRRRRFDLFHGRL
jgi:hypothetical protein